MIGGFRDELRSEGPHTLETAGREATAALRTLRQRGIELVRDGESQLKGRPYIGLAVGAGVGALVGMLVSSRLLRIALIGAVGYLGSRMPLSEATDRIRERLDDKPRKSRGK